MSTYQRLDPIDRGDAEAILASSDPHLIAEAILRSALHDPDGVWVTERALELLESRDIDVRAIAATALGHIARIHRVIDRERVIPALRRLMDNPETVGQAEDTLDDIEIFAAGQQR
ncbi:hydantoinase B/oxoprolinase family protein [Nocardia arthritidis]|uniref:HEAT repeat domain-containing protein n=1 Tax=Nocardia arthritidis TaxID=228602 RepID=A0A6G9YK53_9NOCA|nr:hydantoinase B/oxoprolinase family protein [Nocardia arthritidis]QIS13447.1 hypothetical protein F5544_27970 [Nocardia arthritidis]